MTKPNKCILIPPGGPAGPFWGVMKQSGEIIATQIMEREHARLLVTIGNIAQGDFDTVQAVGNRLTQIWGRDLQSPEPGAEDYVIRSVVEAIGSYMMEEDA